MLLCAGGPVTAASCPCAALTTELRRDGVALGLRKDALKRAWGGRLCPSRLRATLSEAGVFPLRSSWLLSLFSGQCLPGSLSSPLCLVIVRMQLSQRVIASPAWAVM